MKRVIATGLVLSLFAGVAAIAQPQTLTVNKTQNPLGQPLVDARGFPPDDVMIEIPLRADDAKYGDLRGPGMKTMVEEIAAISRRDRDVHGNIYWGRNAGSQGHVEAEDWTIAKFNKLGLTDVHKVFAPPLAMWQAKSYDITFSADGMTFKLPSARPSLSESTTQNLEMIWLGQGSAADFAGRDVRGKAVIIQDIPLPGDIRHTIALEGAVKRAFDNGAAMVCNAYGLSDNFSDWQNTANKPGCNMGYRDSIQLRNLLGEGKAVRINYKLDASRAVRLPAATVWGTLPGNTAEEIFIVAHLDAFFEGALDNASGMAVMVGLAEHFAKIPKSQRRRTIHFIGSVGHHGPFGGAGGPGTKQIHDTHNFSKTAFIINLEHVAVIRTKYWGPNLRPTTAVSPMRWTFDGSPKLLPMVRDSLERFNVATTADMDPTSGGEMGQIFRDAPSLQLITSPEIKHTEQDTPEWVPAVGLQQVARAYARIIDQVNTFSLKDIQPGKWPERPPAGTGGGE